MTHTKIYTAREIEDLNLGINADEISCMISAGYQRSHGNKMTVESVMAWRAEHPHFRKCHFRGKSRLSVKELRALYGPNVRPVDKQKQAAGLASQLSRRTNTDQAPPVSHAGKLGEQSLTHG